MGSHRAAALIALFALSTPALAEAPGWRFSPLPGEGDRAAMGCDRDATAAQYTCLVVRCEDDYSTGLYIHTNRFGGGAGTWTMTLDREDMRFIADATSGLYGGKITENAGTLLDRLRNGTFLYLRHGADEYAPFAFISLAGSMTAINEALYWCAPRVPTVEQNPAASVDPDLPELEKPNEPSPTRPQ